MRFYPKMSSVSVLLIADSDGVVVNGFLGVQFLLGDDDGDWVVEAVEETVRGTLEIKWNNFSDALFCNIFNKAITYVLASGAIHTHQNRHRTLFFYSKIKVAYAGVLMLFFHNNSSGTGKVPSKSAHPLRRLVRTNRETDKTIKKRVIGSYSFFIFH